MKNTNSMACVSVGYQDLLLPADDGLKLVKLLQGAVRCDRKFESRRELFEVIEEPLRVELVVLKPDQVRMPEGAQPEPLRRAPRRLGVSQPLLGRTR